MHSNIIKRNINLIVYNISPKLKELKDNKVSVFTTSNQRGVRSINGTQDFLTKQVGRSYRQCDRKYPGRGLMFTSFYAMLRWLQIYTVHSSTIFPVFKE